MIIQGKPELGLQQHQQEAYKAIIDAYKNDNKAAVVMPTGCGKSFVALQYMMDNKDKNILFMAPTRAIRNQIYEYVSKYIAGEEPTKKRTAKMITEEHFPNFKIVLYPTLLRMKKETMQKLKPDLIIMDELHRTGADKWGKKVDDLIKMYPNAKVLGLTATPDRRDDKDVVDRIFAGNIDYELTLVDAIRRKIVKPPTYVKCDYALIDSLNSIKVLIDTCTDEHVKKELQSKYDKMRKIVEKAEGIRELFAKNIKKRDGKYIIFCKNKENMDEMMQKAKEWFADIDTEPEMYSVYSEYSEKTNRETIERFQNSKSAHLKLLFSIDMLNEGIHIDDISGVVMLRPTDSRIVYLQQLGRALTSDPMKEPTIVFDLVNNYLKNNLDSEINRKAYKKRKPKRKKDINNKENLNEDRDDEENFTEDIDIFRIQGETKEFLNLLLEVKNILKHSNHLINAKIIKKWVEQSGKIPLLISKNREEKSLAEALANIQNYLVIPYNKLKTDEEREEYRKLHPEIDEVISIIDYIYTPKYVLTIRKIKLWAEQSGKSPSMLAADEEERKLADELFRIRRKLIEPYIRLEGEAARAEYRKKYIRLDEVLNIISEIDMKYGKSIKKEKDTLIASKEVATDIVNTYSQECEHSILMEETESDRSLSEILSNENKQDNIKSSRIINDLIEKEAIDELSIEELEAKLAEIECENRKKEKEAKKLQLIEKIKLAQEEGRKLDAKIEEVITTRYEDNDIGTK